MRTPTSRLLIRNEHWVPLGEPFGVLNSAYLVIILQKDKKMGSEESVETKSRVQNHQSIMHQIIATLMPLMKSLGVP